MDTVMLAMAMVALLLLLGLLVAGAARSSASRRPVSAATLPQRPLTDEAVTRISVLLRDGQTIQATKVYREQTGEGLAQAYAAVQRWDPDYPVARGSGPGEQEARAHWHRIEMTVRSLLVTEGKIRAIRWVRKETGVGLTEAKALVDRLD